MSFVYGFSKVFKDGTNVDMSSLSIVESVVFMANQLLIIIGSIWVLVLFIKMCVIIGRSLRDKNPFDLRIVKIVYRYIIISLVVSLLSYISFVIMDELMLIVSAYELVSDVLSSVSTVVMLLIFCDVLKIGHILKEEQDLTI